MIYQLIAAVFVVIGLSIIFGFSAGSITELMMDIIRPKDSLRQRAKDLRVGGKKTGLYATLNHMKVALDSTGKGHQFVLMCCASVVSFVAGVFISLLINNVFLIPAISISMALLPVMYISSTINSYEKQVDKELETALSIITTSYIRNDDIIKAVEENIGYIRPPLNEAFRAFVMDCTAVSSSTKQALYNLKGKVDNSIFEEWVETLISCQDDRSLSDGLQSIVTKLADVRTINTEMQGLIATARMEYYVMVALVLGNIPLLWVLNKDWYATLMHTTAGKITLGICGIVILITAIFMFKFTKPIEYKK